MFCNRCGAELKEDDRFCSKCGAPVRIREDFRRADLEEPKEIYYDEKLYRDDRGLYRDTFLEKKEEKSHAMLVTVAILLVMAVLTAASLGLYFFLKKGNPSQGAEDGAIVISGDGQLSQAGGTGNAGSAEMGGSSDAGGDIVILDEGGQGETADSGQDKAAPESGQAAETETERTAETEAGTEATEKETPQAPPDGLIEAEKIEAIFSSESTASKAAVYVYDLDHNKAYGAGEWETAMYSSALISVPILYTAAVKLDRKEITLNDEITYVNSIGGRGEAYPEEKDGKPYPLSYYLTAMLSYSDNNCMNCLIDFLGLDEINSTCHRAGFSSVELQRKIVAEVTDGKDNYMSAGDVAGMVKELYGGKYRTISSEFMKKYFRIDSGDGYRTVIGLASRIPEQALFLNQNGRGDTRYNEVAVVSDSSCQYVICIMCSGDYGFQYETAVEDISNYIYQSLN
ncbi:MAG: serine hydrolase [Lachnospiraceae bacterium]|nr:serine hydrolase [Lachnospiraceae bacterium]